jgi:hypothetical protein
MALDPRIETIREKYGLSKDDFWQLPQKAGTWLVKHAALEVVAVKADIQFDPPQIIQADTTQGIAVLSVNGSMYVSDAGAEGAVKRELRREWSVGEASPKNNKNAYPWAMAEKRAKDRVILKLTGIHGLVYSEEEMSGEDRGAPQAAAPATISSYRAKQLLKTDVLLEEIDTAKTAKRCDELQQLFTTELAFLPPNWTTQFLDRLALRRAELDKPVNAAIAANESLDRQFAETIGK